MPYRTSAVLPCRVMSETASARLSYDEYLALEQTSEAKHEFVAGEVRAMGGGSIEHGRLASRFTHLLRVALGERPCEVFSSDTKIRIDASDRTTYADLFVVCGSLQRSEVDAEAVTNPIVIVEVLSESTEAYDRGKKFQHYRRLPSLQDYVLVSQQERLAEVWRREGDLWRVTEHGAGDAIQLESLGVDLSLDQLYASPLGEGASGSGG